MARRLWRLIGLGVVLWTATGFGDVSAPRATTAVPFGSRWSADIDGQLIGFEVGIGRVYAVVHVRSALEVIAFGLADGNVLWRHVVARVGMPSRYAGAATEDGFLFSFEDRGPVGEVVVVGSETVGIEDSAPASSAPGELDDPTVATDDGRNSHLMLLDGAGGEIRWDEPLYDPAPYVSGQVDEHVAVVGVYDSGPYFVNLETAESIEMENSQETFWIVVGDELARFDQGSLELGLDPFDPARLPTTIPLPSGTVGVTASEDGRLLVATVGSELVGVAAKGGVLWTWTPDVEAIGQALLVDGFVGVQEIVGGVFGRLLFAEIGSSGVVPLDTLPAGFQLEDVSVAADGSPSLVGIMDETPDMRSRDERVRAALVDLRSGTPIREIADDLNGFGTAGAFGAYIYTASVLDGQISVYRADTLERVLEIPFTDDDEVRPENLEASDNEIVVYDPEESTMSVYA